MFLGSSAAFFLFGVNESLAGRYNLVGLGPNVSCDVIVMVYSISLLLYRKKLVRLRWLIISLIPLILFIPITGSRRALFFLFILIFLTLNAKARLAMIGSLLGFTYLIIEFYTLTWDDTLSSISSITRTLEVLEQINSGTFEDGRLEMYRTSINTILSNPFGVGLSDWAIQAEMSVHGVGSHTHNFFLQMFLKFGLMSVFIFCFFIYCCYFLIKNKYWFHILYFSIGLSTGYGFWNLKYSTIFIWMCLSLSVLAQPISRYSRERLSF